MALGYNITMTKKNLIDSHHVKMVTVYASSSAALRPVYYDAARRTGEILASAGKSIIYGAGGGGLMGSMADGALASHGEVFGVVPGFLQDLELTHRNLTGLKVVDLIAPFIKGGKTGIYGGAGVLIASLYR